MSRAPHPLTAVRNPLARRGAPVNPALSDARSFYFNQKSTAGK
ncbi:MAG: hypothetical protein AB7U49_00425 [Hyphomicrobiaceae bacterium]